MTVTAERNETEIIQDQESLVLIDIEESLETTAEVSCVDEESVYEDEGDSHIDDEKNGQEDDELRKRVEEFIEKVNRAWRAEKLGITAHVLRGTLQF